MVLFAEVVRAGSFTGAAARLGITKQATSERISKLERELGVRLLERTPRSHRVTGVGATYTERCSAIAAQIDEANREAKQQETEPVGLLRVASPAFYARHYLSGFIPRFLTEHAQIQIELVLANRRLNLIEDGLDVAVHIGALEDSSLVARKLGEASTYIVASPRFLKKHGAPTARDLKTARCSGLGPIEFWDVQGTKVRVEPVLFVADHELAYAAAVAGVGITRLPEQLCRKAISAGRLKVLFGPKPTLRRPVYALYPSRSNLPARVRLFVDALAKYVEAPKAS
jgi:DNA-binding transcriptional LysR family regulator